MFWRGLRALGTISFVVVCILVTMIAISIFALYAVTMIQELFYK